MVIIPEPATHAEFAGATGTPGLPSGELRLFMRMTADGIDVEIVDEHEDGEASMTASVRAPRWFGSGVGNACYRISSPIGDICRMIAGERRRGDITVIEFRLSRGHAIMLAFTRDQIFDLNKGLNYIYLNRNEWVELTEVRGAWIIPSGKAQSAPRMLAV